MSLVDLSLVNYTEHLAHSDSTKIEIKILSPELDPNLQMNWKWCKRDLLASALTRRLDI